MDTYGAGTEMIQNHLPKSNYLQGWDLSHI